LKEQKKEKVVELATDLKDRKAEQEEQAKKISFKPSSLKWHNFAQTMPDPDRWFIMWCNMGNIAPNFYISYKDAQGNFDLPHPAKRYAAIAWAYISIPEVDNQDSDSERLS